MGFDNGYARAKQKCSICNSLMRTYDFHNVHKIEHDEGVYILFTGEINLKIRIKDSKFYLVTEWSGCPKSSKNDVCPTSNGDKSEVKINYCPICGKSLSVYRFTKGV